LATDGFDTVEHAIAAFIDAFNDLDRARVEACFAEDVTVFYPWGGERSDAFWTQRFDAERAQQAGPPYQDLQPADVQIQRFEGIAVVTFHLRNRERLGRRTLVLH
jgi:ketosteroid isomerase-like protein